MSESQSLSQPSTSLSSPSNGTLKPITDSPVSMKNGIELHAAESDDEDHDGGEDAGIVGKPLIATNHHSDAASDEEDDDEEEDDEPTLKYTPRFFADLPPLLKKDPASAICVAPGRIVVGTHAGFVYLFSTSNHKRLTLWRPHTASVTCLAFYPAPTSSTHFSGSSHQSKDTVVTAGLPGEWVGSAGLDGIVHIQALGGTEKHAFDLKRPLKSFAFCPGPPNSQHTSPGPPPAFVCGGSAGTVALREPASRAITWPFGAAHSYAKERILGGEGTIWALASKSTIVAWADELGVTIYDLESETAIGHIPQPANSARSDLYGCHFAFKDLVGGFVELIIGWGPFIWNVHICPSSHHTAILDKEKSRPTVEILRVFEMECMIAGIQPYYSSDDLLLLAYTPLSSLQDADVEENALTSSNPADRPELRVLSGDGEELATDALGISDWEKWRCKDYHLTLLDSGGYAVLSPLDVILVQKRDQRDHVDWLIHKDRLEEAWDLLESLEAVPGYSHQEGDVLADEVGEMFLKQLIEIGDVDTVSKHLMRLCQSSKERWEEWVWTFAERGALHLIIPTLPTANPRLSHLIYEVVLANLIKHDPETLWTTVRRWPEEIYDMETVIVALSAEVADSPKSIPLLKSLSHLYILAHTPSRALPFLIIMESPNIFALIKENHLWGSVGSMGLILGLVQLSERLGEERRQRTIDQLVDNIHAIPIERAVSQLSPEPHFLYLYLDVIVQRDPMIISDGVGLGDRLVELYAQFARGSGKLLSFLRTNTSYDLSHALKTVKENKLIEEQVFLLAHMGDKVTALRMIIEEMGDVKLAIDFATEHTSGGPGADEGLWDELLTYSESRPLFIRGLLENIGSSLGVGRSGIPPTRLIRHIRNGLEIPGLRGALIQILSDLRMQTSLLEGCATVLRGDVRDYGKLLGSSQGRGWGLGLKSTCSVCGKALTGDGMVMVFFCRHYVHAHCTPGVDQRDDDLEARKGLSGKIAFESLLRSRLGSGRGCPVCYDRVGQVAHPRIQR